MKKILPFFIALLSFGAVESSERTLSPEVTASQPRTELNFSEQEVRGKTEGLLGNIVEGTSLGPTDSIIDLRENFSDRLTEDAGGKRP